MNQLLHEILTEYLQAGGDVNMYLPTYVSTSSLGNGEIHYDLQVHLKSGIHLTVDDGNVVALERYNRKSVIECMGDVISIYKKWLNDAQTRGWGVVEPESHWEKLLIKYGHLEVSEETVTKKLYNWK